MRLISVFITLAGALPGIGASDSTKTSSHESQVSATCLSSSQVSHAMRAMDSVKHDWSTLASKNKGDLSSNDKLEGLDKLLSHIDSQNKLLKSLGTGEACVENADSRALQSSSTSLLDVIHNNLAHFYDLAKAALSDISQKADSVDLVSPQVDARRQRGGGRGRYEPVYQYPPGYVPAYQPPPQGYQPAYEPQITGYYQSGGYGQPAPVQGGSSPHPAPDTGGYQYQGGDEADSKKGDGLLYTPQVPVDRSEGQPYYYQPAYYQPDYYQPQPPQGSAASDSKPNLNDKDGNFILHFAEHLTETVLYQLEVIGYEFGGGRSRQSSKAVGLVSDTKNEVLQYAAQILGH